VRSNIVGAVALKNDTASELFIMKFAPSNLARKRQRGLISIGGRFKRQPMAHPTRVTVDVVFYACPIHYQTPIFGKRTHTNEPSGKLPDAWSKSHPNFVQNATAATRCAFSVLVARS
jgi:hypothetical protein